MLVTSAQANKILRSLIDERDFLSKKENGMLTTEYLATDAEPESEEFSVAEMQEKFDSINGMITRVKHAINVFNTTTVIDENGTTIDQALVLLPILNERKSRLDRMRGLKSGVKSRLGYNQESIMMRVNYSVDDAYKMYHEIEERIQRLQLGIDSANLSVQFDIDLDVNSNDHE